MGRWNKIKKERKVAVIIVWGLVLAMLTGILGYFFYEQRIKPGKHYQRYQIASRVERGDTADTHYLQYGNRILRYNRDGISVIDGEGTIIWTAAYNMQNPTVSMAGDYVAAAEIPVETMLDVKNAMEDIDDLSQDFSFCKPYQSSERTKHLIKEFLDSTQLSVIQKS